MSLDQIMREQGRLIILRELAGQPNYSLNETLLTAVLDQFGISRSRDWTRQEMRYLAEIGAATITQAGSEMIAIATERGLEHVSGRSMLEGVKRPSPGKV